LPLASKTPSITQKLKRKTRRIAELNLGTVMGDLQTVSEQAVAIIACIFIIVEHRSPQ